MDKANEHFCSVDGNLYTKDKKTLVRYACGKVADTFEVPQGVEKISAYAFDEAHLRNIKLPDSLKEIGDYAFANNYYQLNGITIPKSVASMGRSVFHNDVFSRVITCEALSQPEGWSDDWNPDKIEVKWGAARVKRID